MDSYIIDLTSHNNYGGFYSFDAWEKALNDEFGGTWKLLGSSGDNLSISVEINNKTEDQIREKLEAYGAKVDSIREG